MLSIKPTLIFLFVLLGFSSSALAQTQLQVSAGFGQRVVEGTMTPLHIQLEHQGTPFEGQLILEQSIETPFRGVHRERLSTDVALGQRANKNLTLYFPLESIVYPLEIRLVNSEGDVIAEQSLDLRDIGQVNPLVVALSDVSFPPQLPTGEIVLSLNPDEIPDHVSAFESLQRLYLGSFDLSQLSEPQQQALWHWVMLGGEMVVFAGENWYVQDTPALAQWLPLLPEQVVSVKFNDQDIFMLQGPARGQVLQLHDDLPLLVRQPLGQGRVWLSSINPLATEMDNRFWQHLQPIVIAALSQTPFPAELPTGESILQLDPDVMPNDVNGFQSIQRLYLGDFNLMDLSAAQRQALEQWLTLDGELVVFSGDNWPTQSNAFLREWLPMTPEQLRRASFEDGQTVQMLSGTTRGQTVQFKESQPWLIRRSATQGQGQVWLATMNPLTMEVPANFWLPLKPTLNLENSQTFEQLAVELFAQQPLEVPAKTLVGLMLVVFIGGVAMWTWLSLKKTFWIWILLGWTAGSGVVFAVFINQPHYAKPLTRNEYGIETILPDGEAFSQTWVGYYSQRREQLHVNFPTHDRPWQQLPLERGEHLFDMDYAVADATQLQLQTHPQQTRILRSSGTHPAHVSWSTLSNGALQVVSRIDLEQVWLLHQGNVLGIGPMAADQPRQIQFSQLALMQTQRQLPKAVHELWTWVLEQQQPPTLLAAWHHQSDIQPSDSLGTYRLIVAEVTP